MDIRMPVLDGLAATRRIVAEQPESKVVILTTFDLDEHVFEALRSGASGFLLKDAPAEELIRAVRTVAGGAALLDPAVTRRVIETADTAASGTVKHWALAPGRPVPGSRVVPRKVASAVAAYVCPVSGGLGRVSGVPCAG